MVKQYFRCHVCSDIHHGMRAPDVCPTCKAENAYVEIDEREAAAILELKASAKSMSKEEMIKAWKIFAEKSDDFILNEDEKLVGMVADGVLANQEKYNFKLCPCRLTDGSKARNVALTCPCNFITHETWRTRGDCWCGLFKKN